jgi:luciferase-like monooxygenase
MKFGMLHFFEQPAGGKTEHQVIKEQLDCMRAAEDFGFDYIWVPSTMRRNTATALRR